MIFGSWGNCVDKFCITTPLLIEICNSHLFLCACMCVYDANIVYEWGFRVKTPTCLDINSFQLTYLCITLMSVEVVKTSCWSQGWEKGEN